MSARRLAAFVFVSHLLSASLASGQATNLQSAYSSIAIGQSLIWVTKEAGIFKENGLDVQILFIGSSTVVTQAILGGNVPIAVLSGATAINSALSGSDLVILASTKKEPAQAFLVVSKEITNGAQLKGKRLGVSWLGASSDFLLRYLLKKNGPRSAMGGVQLALEEIAERNPAAKSARPEQFVDTSFVRELDESGYIDALYR